MKYHQSVPAPDGSGEWGKAVPTFAVSELVHTHLYQDTNRSTKHIFLKTLVVLKHG